MRQTEVQLNDAAALSPARPAPGLTTLPSVSPTDPSVVELLVSMRGR